MELKAGFFALASEGLALCAANQSSRSGLGERDVALARAMMVIGGFWGR